MTTHFPPPQGPPPVADPVTLKDTPATAAPVLSSFTVTSIATGGAHGGMMQSASSQALVNNKSTTRLARMDVWAIVDLVMLRCGHLTDCIQ